MLPKYEHTQKASRLLYYVSIFFVLEVLAIEAFVFLIGTRGKEPMTPEQLRITMLLIALVPSVILGWAFLLMSSLTVSIDSNYMRMRMGPGAWIKKFKLDQITDCKPVINNWMNGWGIHYIGNRCWLYNIAGMKAVEIAFHNGTKVRIGTDQPDELATAIKTAID
ncbi:MAG: hypothetical protein ACYTER_08885 [Planctomycetota bacterium]